MLCVVTVLFLIGVLLQCRDVVLHDHYDNGENSRCAAWATHTVPHVVPSQDASVAHLCGENDVLSCAQCDNTHGQSSYTSATMPVIDCLCSAYDNNKDPVNTLATQSVDDSVTIATGTEKISSVGLESARYISHSTSCLVEDGWVVLPCCMSLSDSHLPGTTHFVPRLEELPSSIRNVTRLFRIFCTFLAVAFHSYNFNQ